MDAYTENIAPGGSDAAHLPLSHIQREAKALPDINVEPGNQQAHLR